LAKNAENLTGIDVFETRGFAFTLFALTIVGA
jgi:hypothetical protein